MPVCHQSFFDHATRTPERVALIVDGRAVSYGALAGRAKQLALQLLERGSVGNVLLASDEREAFVVGLYGIWLAGGAAVPVPEGAAQETWRMMAERTSASVVVGAPPIDISAISTPGEATDVANVDAPVTPDDDALLLFTSGTTSRRKAVRLSHAAVSAATAHINQVMQPKADIVEAVAIPFYHSFGLGRLRCVLDVGGTVVVDNGLLNPAKLVQSISARHVNALSSVPAGLALFMGRFERFLKRVGAQIELVEIGSAPMPRAHKETLLTLLPNARIFMHYGLTEASRSAFLCLNDGDWTTVGRASPNVNLTIVDGEDAAVAAGQEGEIVVDGPHLFSGYLGDDALYAAARSRFGHRTGDLGVLDDDGALHLRGRADEMINCGGVKISPVELEDALRPLFGAHPFAVVGVADPEGRSGTLPVVAQKRGGPFEDHEALLAAALQLVDKQKHPRALVHVDEIPTTHNGKVQRGQLAKSIAGSIDPAV